MDLTKHCNYSTVAEAAERSFREGRAIQHLSPAIVLLARLYSYAFGAQAIGAYHATGQALDTLEKPGAASGGLAIAREHLDGMKALALETVPNDFRAVVTTFHRYDQHLARIIQSLSQATEICRSEELRRVTERFIAAMERITGSSGIVLTRDDQVPYQGSFVVPGLGITIVPIVYGDRHSWNAAFLSDRAIDVPLHIHRQGVEIHLGFGELHGQTCLGSNRAEVREGYAMPIPSGFSHGFVNSGGHDHFLPFIFGSRNLGGWGLFPDVEPQSVGPTSLTTVDAASPKMNAMVLLDREIVRAAEAVSPYRQALVSAERTFSVHSGGLALSIARIGPEGMRYAADRFQIVGVVRGRGRVTIGDVSQEIGPHDHFGIPAGADALLEAIGSDPFVVLDSVLLEECAGAKLSLSL